MSRLIAFASLLFWTFGMHAQEQRDYLWQLGPASTDSAEESIVFDFSTGFKIRQESRSCPMYLTNASICASDGTPLFYSNGCAIYDNMGVILNNSDSLNPGLAYDNLCAGNVGYGVSDGAQFINFGDTLFYLVHQRLEYASHPTRVFVDGLYLTSIKIDNGVPKVVYKQKQILSDTLTTGQVECIKDQNTWLVVVSRREDNLYYILRLFSNGDINITTQRIGLAPGPGGSGAGQSVFSPTGDLFARFTPQDQLFLFKFDRTTAVLSDFQYVPISDSGSVGGIAFSANSQFLYVSSEYDLYQLDVRSDDVLKSITFIDHYDGYLAPFSTTFYLMQLGPDCRIYMIPPNGANVMHVINSPDTYGTSCKFQQHGISLPTYNSISLPNFPNYRIDQSLPCDSSITSTSADPSEEEVVSIWPNPASDHITVSQTPGIALFQIYDLHGRLAFSQSISSLNEHTISFDLASGIYFYQMITQSGQRKAGKLAVEN